MVHLGLMFVWHSACNVRVIDDARTPRTSLRRTLHAIEMYERCQSVKRHICVAQLKASNSRFVFTRDGVNNKRDETRTCGPCNLRHSLLNHYLEASGERTYLNGAFSIIIRCFLSALVCMRAIRRETECHQT